MNDSRELSVFGNQGLTPEQEQVCALIAGGKSIDEACKRVGVTQYRYAQWLAQVPAFEAAVRRARAIIVDRRIDRMAYIAEHEPDVNRARLMIDTDKWLASKLIPKVYGDKLDITLDARIDIGDALAAARARAVVRPMRDSTDVIEGEVIDSRGKDSAGSIDKQSTAPTLPDIFS